MINRQPSIADARKATKVLGVQGVLIVALSPEGIGAASYGSTKAQCSQLGKLLDFIISEVEAGKVDLSTFDVGDCPWPMITQGD